MLDELTPAQFDEWVAFDRLEREERGRLAQAAAGLIAGIDPDQLDAFQWIEAHEEQPERERAQARLWRGR